MTLFDPRARNAVVLLTIGCVNALFVIVVFMHARVRSHLTWIVVASGFVRVIVMLTFTMADYTSRS